MDMTFFIFLSSGLFLGWSLGANDASNVFGTAVGTKMVSFKTAAVIASLFITVGAVYAGAAPAKPWENWVPSIRFPAPLWPLLLPQSVSTGWRVTVSLFLPLRLLSVPSSAGTSLPTSRLIPKS